MDRYKDMAHQARNDETGSSTQAGTVKGYVINRAGFASHDITMEMKRAATDYVTNKVWYDVPPMPTDER
jgi:hypothetical protein